MKKKYNLNTENTHIVSICKVLPRTQQVLLCVYTRGDEAESKKTKGSFSTGPKNLVAFPPEPLWGKGNLLFWRSFMNDFGNRKYSAFNLVTKDRLLI